MAEVEEFLNRQINEAVNAAMQKRLTQIYAAFASESEEAKTHRRQIALINSKDLITISEAAFIIGCSESTLRKKVEETRKFLKSNTRRGLSLVGSEQNKLKPTKDEQDSFDPVPFIDKSKIGIILFERVKLLEWIKNSSPDRQERKEVA